MQCPDSVGKPLHRRPPSSPLESNSTASHHPSPPRHGFRANPALRTVPESHSVQPTTAYHRTGTSRQLHAHAGHPHPHGDRCDTVSGPTHTVLHRSIQRRGRWTQCHPLTRLCHLCLRRSLQVRLKPEDVQCGGSCRFANRGP
jgi:hypothetical protein